MAPRRKISQDEPNSQNPAFSRPGKPTLTLPSPNANPTGGYYPETQLKGMESAMRPRGGFVDLTMVKIPPQPTPELGSIDPASEKVILPRWSDFSAKEREEEEQREKKEKEDRYLRHQYSHHRLEHSLEDGMALDTDRDLARISEKQASAAKESRDASDGADSMALEGETKQFLNRRSNPQWHAPTAPKTDADTQALLPAPETFFPLELHGIDSLIHNTPQDYQQYTLTPSPPCLFTRNCTASPTSNHANQTLFQCLQLGPPEYAYLGFVVFLLLVVGWLRYKERAELKEESKHTQYGQDCNEKHAFSQKSGLECEAGWTVDEIEYYHIKEIHYLVTEKHEDIYPASHNLLDEKDSYRISHVLDERAYPESHFLDEEEIVGFEMEMRVFSALFPGEDI